MFFRGTRRCLNPLSQLSRGRMKALYTGSVPGPGGLLGGLCSSSQHGMSHICHSYHSRASRSHLVTVFSSDFHRTF